MEPNPAAIFCPVNFNDIPELFRIGRATSCDNIRVVYRPNDIDSFIALLRAAGYEACIDSDTQANSPHPTLIVSKFGRLRLEQRIIQALRSWQTSFTMSISCLSEDCIQAILDHYGTNDAINTRGKRLRRVAQYMTQVASEYGWSTAYESTSDTLRFELEPFDADLMRPRTINDFKLRFDVPQKMRYLYSPDTPAQIQQAVMHALTRLMPYCASNNPDIGQQTEDLWTSIIYLIRCFNAIVRSQILVYRYAASTSSRITGGCHDVAVTDNLTAMLSEQIARPYNKSGCVLASTPVAFACNGSTYANLQLRLDYDYTLGDIPGENFRANPFASKILNISMGPCHENWNILFNANGVAQPSRPM